MSEKSKSPPGNIPQLIFSEFLDGAAKCDVPAEVIERLRDILIEKKECSEKAIRAALFQAEVKQ